MGNPFDFDERTAKAEPGDKKVDESLQEKLEWLASIGGKEFERPAKYIYTFAGLSGDYVLSEEYFRNSSLEKLKADYEQNRKIDEELIFSLKKRQAHLPLNDNDKTNLLRENTLVFQPVLYDLDRDCRAPESQ